VAWPEAAEALLSQSPPFSPAASPLQEPPSPDGCAQRALITEGVEGTRKKLIDVFEEPDDASEPEGSEHASESYSSNDSGDFPFHIGRPTPGLDRCHPW
jgi:hypothetical protein